MTKKHLSSLANEFSAAILKSARETIPRGARKDYKPYWTAEIQKLENDLEQAKKET
uniref:Uncharacterized protein n=1 Tax=Arion vulgaris TaxID=1028688 RepID=A0A0B6Y4I4_9EUPU